TPRATKHSCLSFPRMICTHKTTPPPSYPPHAGARNHRVSVLAESPTSSSKRGRCYFLFSLMIAAANVIESMSGIAVPQTGNSGMGVLIDNMDELLEVKVVAVALVDTCVSVMNGG